MALKYFTVFLCRRGKKSAFLAALDGCFPGTGQETLNLFNSVEQYSIRKPIYTSLSEHPSSEDFQ